MNYKDLRAKILKQPKNNALQSQLPDYKTYNKMDAADKSYLRRFMKSIDEDNKKVSTAKKNEIRLKFYQRTAHIPRGLTNSPTTTPETNMGKQPYQKVPPSMIHQNNEQNLRRVRNMNKPLDVSDKSFNEDRRGTGKTPELPEPTKNYITNPDTGKKIYLDEGSNLSQEAYEQARDQYKKETGANNPTDYKDLARAYGLQPPNDYEDDTLIDWIQTSIQSLEEGNVATAIFTAGNGQEMIYNLITGQPEYLAQVISYLRDLLVKLLDKRGDFDGEELN